VDRDILLFHAGTTRKPSENGIGTGAEILTNGGRVLGVAITADTLDEARKRVFENVAKIHFDGMQYRKDIGILVNKQPLK